MRDALEAATDKACADVADADLARVRDLSLGKQQLTALHPGDFAGLTGLETLDLSNNELTALPDGIFDDLTNLHQLFLHRNALTELPAGVFDGLSNLERLNIFRNRLESLPAGVFDGLSGLERLYLSRNRLETLDADMFRNLPSLELLRLHNNPGEPFTVTLNREVAESISIRGGEVVVLETVTATPEPPPAATPEPPPTAVTPEPPTARSSHGAPVCERTAGVRSALEARIGKACANITEEDLAKGLIVLNTGCLDSVQSGDFAGLTNMHTLDLDCDQPGSGLSELPADILAGMPHLHRLWLRGNRLTTLPDPLFNGPNELNEVLVVGNPGAPFSNLPEFPNSRRPRVKITAGSLVNDRFVATFTFSGLSTYVDANSGSDVNSGVSGFTADDITVTGGGVKGAFTGADGDTVYTLTVTANSYPVTVRVGPHRAIDARTGYGNRESNVLSVQADGLDTIPPDLDTVTASSSGRTGYAKAGDTITVEFTTTEPLANTPRASINGSSAAVSGSGASWTATWQVPADGNVANTEAIFSIGSIADAAGNSQEPDARPTGIVIDTVAPVPSLSTNPSSLVGINGVFVSIDFGDVVTPLAPTGITVTNRDIVEFVHLPPSSDRWSLWVTGTANPVTVNVPAGVATDAAGNPSAAAALISIPWSAGSGPTQSATPPDLDIVNARSSGRAGYAKAGDTITVEFTTTKELAAAPAATINGLAATVSGSGAIWTATWQAPADGNVANTDDAIFDLGSITDGVGNSRDPDARPTGIAIDTIAPVPSLSANPGSLVGSAITAVAIDFGEATTLLSSARIMVTNGSVIAISSGPSSGSWLAQVSGVANPVRINVPAGIVTDLAGNPNAAAGPLSIPWSAGEGPDPDITPPNLDSVNARSSGRTGYAKAGDTITVEFTTTKALAATPAATINGLAATVSGIGASWTATWQAPADGNVANTDDAVFDLGPIIDGAGNSQNPRARPTGIAVDTVAPAPSLSANPGSLVGSATTAVAIDFGEATTLLSSARIMATNGSVIAVSSGPSPGSWLAQVTGVANPVTVNVPAGIVTDLAGNPNAAAAPLSIPWSAATEPANDREALMALYNAADGDNWTNNTNWGTDKPITEWFGVYTEPSPNGEKVRALSLDLNGLNGELPAALGSLDQLEHLGLSNNRLYGPIPPEWSGMTNLEFLDLTANRNTTWDPDGDGAPGATDPDGNPVAAPYAEKGVSGAIPDWLTELERLESVSLGYNSLTGGIPSGWESERLRDLRLRDNNLSGELGDALDGLTGLRALYVNKSGLTGYLPEILQDRLSVVNMDSNGDPERGVCARHAVYAALVANDATMNGAACNTGDPYLIDVHIVQELHVIRYDADGDGRADDPSFRTYYDARYPRGWSGCPGGVCRGYELVADLDFDEDGDGERDDTYNQGAGWRRMSYSAIFNGNGKTISNLYIDLTGAPERREWAGLFGRLRSEAVVSNLRLENVDITGRSLTGGLAADLDGATVTNVSVSGVISATERIVGGLVGRVYANSTITDSHSTATVTGDGSTGGLVGSSSFATITRSYATGDVTTTANGMYESVSAGDFAGGLVGRAWLDTITESYATGNVTGSLNRVGGLIGFDYASTIKRTYAAGDVVGIERVGGLVGELSDGTITASYATGSVTGDRNVGGLVGLNTHVPQDTVRRPTLTATYATGSVTGPLDVGGLVGQSLDGLITASYYNSDNTVQTDAVGENIRSTVTDVSGKTTSELQTPTGATGIYAAWSVDDWNFGISTQYPILKCCPVPSTN